MVKKYSKKDKDGNPEQVSSPGQGITIQVDPKQKDAFDKELKELEDEHREVVDERLDQLQKFSDLLQEEIEISLVKVKKKDLPETLKVSEIYNISDILEDL